MFTRSDWISGRVSPKTDLAEIINSEGFRRMVGGIVKSVVPAALAGVTQLTTHLGRDPRTVFALELAIG